MSASQPDRRNRPAPTISGNRRRKPRPRIDLGRTAIERLEDRTLLANDLWIGGDGNNNWSNPGNWTQGVPGTSTTVEFQNGTTTATVDASFTIGALQIDSSWGGTLNISNPLAVSGDLTLASGTLSLGEAMSIGGSGSEWTGGGLSLNGKTLTNNGTLTIAPGSGGLTLSGGGTLDNAGTIDQADAGNLSLTYSVTIDNESGATYDFQADSSIVPGYENGTFTNAGTLEKTVTTGTSSITTGFGDSGTVEALSGTLSIPNASLVSSGTLGAGTWVVGTSSTPTLSGVSSIATISVTVMLQGSGAIFTGLSSLATINTTGTLNLLNGATLTTSGNLVNDGIVELAAGTLNVAGTYTQASTGDYEVGIGGITPGISYGQLNVTKSASLGGTLDVSLINGYTPPQGDSYAILTFASETGNFSAEFGLYFGSGSGFTPTFSPSTNPTAFDLVVVAEAGATQTTVKSSENPSNYGDSVTFTATVTPTVSTRLVPQGQVTFYDGSTAIDTEALVNGSASYTTSLLIGGPHSIVAQYTDNVDSNFSGSNSTPALSQTVNPIVSLTGLQSSEDPSIDGDSGTFTATVSSSSSTPGVATPTGKVEFYDGSTLLDTETLSDGTASYSTSALVFGANQNIEAEYLGDNITLAAKKVTSEPDAPASGLMAPAGMRAGASGSSERTSPSSAHEPEIEPVPGALNRSMLVHGGSAPAVSQHGHRWSTMELQRVHAGPWWLSSGSEPAWSSVVHHGAPTGPCWSMVAQLRQ